MVDEQVKKVQQSLNSTYADINISEDGYTGQGTVSALIKALQHEMVKLGAGISADGDFGKGSYRAFQTYIGSIAQGGTHINLNYIVQGGCWCKGYNPGGFDGVFGAGTAGAIGEMQKDAGLTEDGAVTAVLMKALLNTDGFKKALSSNSTILAVQQLLNAKYSGTYGPDIGLVPTDGVYDRKTSKAMLYGVQVEGGVGADGIWGNGTKACLPDLAMGSANKAFVTLMQCALVLNGCLAFKPNGLFNILVRSAVIKFQGLMALMKSGSVDKATWCALLVSCGDRSRSTVACDCATKITPAYARTLVDNGYTMVGRYLTGTYRAAGGVLKSKALDAQELKTIFDAGLKVFPIFETGGFEASYFSRRQGEIDAGIAMNAARALGFGRQAVVYFAVDCDTTEKEISRYIIPYFHGVFERYYAIGAPFGVGIYGTRNVCAKVSAEKDATTDTLLVSNAFIADMSTGWSGNTGFVIPSNWAFDQYDTVTIGSGDSAIEIDKDGYSGLNEGESSVNPEEELTEHDLRVKSAQSQFINEVFHDMPLFELLPASIRAKQRYTIFNVGVLKAEFSYDIEMAPKTKDSIAVVNGELDSAKVEILEGASLSVDLKEKYINPLRAIGLTVSNGMITVSVSDMSLARLSITITVSTGDLDVNDGSQTKVSATLKYTITDSDEIRKQFNQFVAEAEIAVEEAYLFLIGVIQEALKIVVATVAIATVIESRYFIF